MITCMSEHVHDLVKKCVEEHPDLPAQDRKAILAGLDKLPRCQGAEKMGFTEKCEGKSGLGETMASLAKAKTEITKEILPIVAMAL